MPSGMLAAPIHSPNNLLKYYEEHGVIICKLCQFAIQPSALASHLLKHQVYRSERRKLLEGLSELALKEPKDVIDPPPLSEPIPELQVCKGARCLAAGCQYICASEKRMSQHWSDVHGERESRRVHARLAWLQTFFRGNKIRYFEVSRPLAASIVTGRVSTGHNDTNLGVEDVGVPSSITSTLDMENLKYLLHYKECTALTMPRTECETVYFWSTTIAHEALHHPFLMGGILGMAALHLAETVPDVVDAQRHYEAMLRYSVSSDAEFRRTQDQPDRKNATALIAYVRLAMIQQCCPGPNPGASPRDATPLYKAYRLNKGVLDILLALQHLLPEDNGFKLPVEEIEDLSPLNDESASQEYNRCFANIPRPIREQLQNVSAHFIEMMQHCGTHDTVDFQACLDANVALLSAYARAHSCSTTHVQSAELYIGGPHPKTVRAVWGGIESWLRTTSDHYVTLLEQGNSAALLVFAHWSIMLNRFKYRYWYFRDLKEAMLHVLEANLDEASKPLLANLWTIDDDP